MDNTFAIGVSDFTNRTFTKKKWHKMEGGDNLFRVLPPVHSLAATGRFAQYYATHGGFKSSKGWQFNFQCIEKKDRTTKLVTQHCPVCDMVAERKKQFDLLKVNPAVTEEQRSAFHTKLIMPFQAQKKFYVNAIDAAGEIGILPLPYKCFQSLEELCKKQKAGGFDVTGVNGAYLTFSKQSRFKGDAQVNYFVSLALEQDGDNMRFKKHELTPAIIEQLRTKTADLGALYRTIPVEDIALLVGSDDAQRAAIVDRLFGKSEQAETTSDDETMTPIPGTGVPGALGRTIPGTSAIAVGRPEMTPNGFAVQAPDMPTVYQQPAPTPSPNPVGTPAPQQQNLNGATVAPLTAPAPAPSLNGKPGSAAMSDSEFNKMFMPPGQNPQGA